MTARPVDLSRISDSDARRLLTEYTPVIRRLHATQYRELPADEALAVGTDAVLEAFLSCDLARSAESTWIRKVLHWRMAEACRRQPWDSTADSLDVDPQVLNGKSPEEAYVRASAVAALTTLPIRQQMIVEGHMRGETYASIGEQLGISAQRAHTLGKQAVIALRKAFGVP